MKAILAVVVSALALVGFVTIALILLTYGETSKSRFATYDELEASGLIARRWLPDFLPRSITDITEEHNIDTNRVWATFQYDPKDIRTIEENCRLVLKSAQGSKYHCSPYEKRTSILILRSNGTATLKISDDEI